MTRRHEVLAAILRERARQDKLHPWDAGAPASDRLAVLVEEIGECASEVQEMSLGPRRREAAKPKLRTELVQVAAYALRWLENDF